MSPAISMARMLWQALTPEPHWCTICSGVAVLEQRPERGAQLLWGLEAAVCTQVVLVEAIQRSGDVAGHGIDRLGFAAVALGRASVDDRHSGCVQVRQHVVHVDRDVARAGR